MHNTHPQKLSRKKQRLQNAQTKPKQTNITSQGHPKQEYRREKRLRNAQRSKNRRKTAKEMIEKGKQEEKKKQINK